MYYIFVDIFHAQFTGFTVIAYRAHGSIFEVDQQAESRFDFQTIDGTDHWQL